MGRPVKLLNRPTRTGAALLVLAALGAALAAGWWATASQSQDLVWQRIHDRGVLTVASDLSYPPFSALDENGSLFGFDVDLAEALGQRWGVRVEFENIAYDALLNAVISQRDDVVISAYVPRPEYAREASFSVPYFVAGTVAVVRRGAGLELAGDPERWAEGKTFAVEYGAAGDALARRWKRRVAGVSVLPQATAAEAMQVVENNQADAALVDAVSAFEFLQAHAGLGLAGPPLEPETYAIVVSARSNVLLRELNLALAAMEADGTLVDLRVKWFGEAAR